METIIYQIRTGSVELTINDKKRYKSVEACVCEKCYEGEIEKSFTKKDEAEEYYNKFYGEKFINARHFLGTCIKYSLYDYCWLEERTYEFNEDDDEFKFMRADTLMSDYPGLENYQNTDDDCDDDYNDDDCD